MAGALLLLSGCSAAPAPIPAPTPVPATDAFDVLSDTLTIIYNAASAHREGRSTQQEYDGAKAVAARVLARAPVDPGTPLAAAFQRLQEVAPGDATPKTAGLYDTESQVWRDALADASDACKDAGAELAISKWTGG